MSNNFKFGFFVFVLIPFLLGFVYINFYASERYVSGGGFAIRNTTNQVNSDLVSSLTGLVPAGPSVSDSYIICKFLKSRDIIEAITEEIDLVDVYSRESIDLFSKMKKDLKMEGMLKYWNRMIDADFDPTSGIIRFNIQAFDPNSAHLLSQSILRQVEKIINRLSEEARADSLSFAYKELEIAENRLIESRNKINAFRNNIQSVDINALAMSQVDLIFSLEKQFAEISARIKALEETLEPEAPSIKLLYSKAHALRNEIEEKSGGLGIAGYDKISELLSQQENLEAKKAFAENTYSSALAALDSARMASNRDQRYLAIYSYPSLPEDALYPKRITYSLYLLLILIIIWGICSLVISSMRDHISAEWLPNEANKKSFFTVTFSRLKNKFFS